MVDCFDRIAVQMTEIALEPVRLLPKQSMLNAVTLRVASGGRKFTVTIAKRFPEGQSEPVYVWTVQEIDAVGEPLPGAAPRELPLAGAHRDPVTAYWSAVDGLCALREETD